MTGDVRLPYIELGTSLSGARHGAELYAAAVEPVFDLRYDESRTAALNVNLKSSIVGPVILTHASMDGVDLNYSRCRGRVARSGLDLIMLQVSTRGGDHRSVDGGEARETRAGDICVIDMTRQVQTWTPGCENLNLTVPRELLAPDERQIDGLHGTIIRRETATATVLLNHMSTLWSQLPTFSPAEGEVLGRATADMVAHLLLPGLTDGGGPLLNAQIQHIKRYIEAHLAQPDLGPSVLCRAFAMSRAKLYRLFAPLGGIAGYIRSRRLQRVYSALGMPGEHHRSIADIAYGWGFNDLSAFARAFKSRFDLTPGDVRGMATSERSLYAMNDMRRLADLRAWLYNQ